ncbi:CheR family methyltransferase [Spirochaeta africana]|uniref:protein-glutamate O-methyltransferase n=1 Tax=Spirochaeta africana (strain ATCC 700263 / DSM 8902 / Z-7692) TaxID=889378 RepID=H9UK80_SPIAZ|nr:protein-glutamate O-methyltransferase [Spirochaeta africana]AFG37923.1 methylase of chemotaxis methyl-accepting protein [Spirochaeta africana DSM 8902]
MTHNDIERTTAGGPPRLAEKEFQVFQKYIEGQIGIKMPPAKRVMLESRLLKRLRVLGIGSFGEYLEIVFDPASAQTELVHMIDAVTTNKTDFFRENEHFRYLSSILLPERLRIDEWGRDNMLKVWSCASSSGEEVYSLAMTLEEFARNNSPYTYRILGTDISTRMLERCRAAVYPAERIEPVPESLRKRYLLRSKDRTAGLVKIRPELRSRVQFHRVNLMDGDFGIRDTFQIIFCRNVIIYFDRERQVQLMHKLHAQLAPGGYLFLGHSETLAGMDVPFRTVAPTVYRKE